MNIAHIRNRNYRTVESVRQQNMWEQRRLTDQIYSRQGMTAAHKYELANMSHEQRKLKEELARIQKSTSTTQGKLPPRKHNVTFIISDGRSPRDSPQRKGTTVKKHEANVVLLDDRKPRLFNKQGIPLQQTKNDSKETSVEETKAKQLSQNRINSETKKTENTLQKFNSAFGVDHEPFGTKSLSVETRSSARTVPPNNRSHPSIQEIDLKNARVNVKQRLGVNNGETPSKQNKTEHKMMFGALEQRPLSPIYEAGHVAERSPKKPSLQVLIDTKMKVGEAVTKLRKVQKQDAENEYDPSRYNPDGSLRTMYRKQDFKKSIAEAKKARYIRHKEKQWFEKELTVQQIFEQGTIDEETENTQD